MLKYDKMDYSSFTKHLKKNNIKYLEKDEVDIDCFFAEYVKITPLDSRIKERYFNTDGGSQLFFSNTL